jgi:hypothetical protein
MEFPPEDYAIFAATDFDTAAPRSAGAVTMELLVQTRPNGRMLDHFRIGIGGNKLMEVKAPLGSIIFGAPSKWILTYQFWGRDVHIRRNMTTSIWWDVYSLIKENNAGVVDETGAEVPAEVVLKALDKLPDGRQKSAIVRVCAAVAEDLRMELVMQSLPMSQACAEGKPSYRG